MILEYEVITMNEEVEQNEIVTIKKKGLTQVAKELADKIEENSSDQKRLF